MSSITSQAWLFDPAFQHTPFPSDWNWDQVSDNEVETWGGEPINPEIQEVTFTDVNGDDLLTGGDGDVFEIGGIEYSITQVYNGDTMRVDGQWYDTVTFYGRDSEDNDIGITLPVSSDGNLTAAFSGSVDATTYVLTPNEYSLPISEVPCFLSGTKILTDEGYVEIDRLAVGDLVITKDHSLQPIGWIGSRSVSGSDLTRSPKLRPIRIRAGALGVNQPEQDLLVSPQHRVLLRSKIVQRMFGANEVLAAANQLLELDGVEIAEDVEAVSYWHFMFETHQIVFSNGAATESMYAGSEALKAVSPEAREEILTLFPDLRDHDATPIPARRLLKGREARNLVARHVKNNKAVLSTAHAA